MQTLKTYSKRGALFIMRNQNIGGFDVAMNHQVLMRVMNGRANGAENLQAHIDGELVAVAIVSDGQAVDELHHEVGETVSGGTPVKDFCDIGMIEAGQDLPLVLKPGTRKLCA